MEKDELWEELRFEIGTMNRLNSSKEDEEILLGSGNKEAKVLFIGDDAELYETSDLKVAVGSSGEFLIKLCDIAEISPEDYYITTLTKSKIKYRETFDDEKRKLKDLLDMQIALIQPEIIVALGQDVGELLLEKEIDMGRERGEVKTWRGGIKLITTYDVNFTKKSRDSSGKKSKVALDFWNDFKSVKSLLNGAEIYE